MKKIILGIASLLLFVTSKAQSLEDFTFGVHISPGTTFASVKDENPITSRLEPTSDGYTTIDENGLRGGGLNLTVDYGINENLFLSSGLYFSKRRLNIKNEDGSYIGTSIYHINYIHIPITIKYRTEQIIDKVRLNFGGGPTIDLKTGEKNIGADYAHFMNFAQNRYDVDASRGANGNGKSLNLFNGTGLSFLFNVGAEYEIKENLNLYFGISYQQGLTNILNSKLKFNDTEKTKFKDTISWRSSLLTLDLGINFSLSK